LSGGPNGHAQPDGILRVLPNPQRVANRPRKRETQSMPLRIVVSRHSVFYSPLIATIAAGFLERRGLTAEYAVLAKGQRSSELIRDAVVDVMQSAVSSNWGAMERGESPLPVHFAQINRRDGFFLVAREPDAAFAWNKLAGQAVLADHGAQPLVMLKYAARSNGVEWSSVNAIDAGPPAEMARAFRQGHAAYVHLQSPDAHRLECDGVGHVVASVGASMAPVAFSSLCCSRDFVRTDPFGQFLQAYRDAREWVRVAPAGDVARAESRFFPEYSLDALTGGIEAYRKIGCWEGGVDIPRELYEQALNVFQTEGAVARRHSYEEVCAVELEQLLI
jgi:NitT/TauT family transport system substrate-binding protein